MHQPMTYSGSGLDLTERFEGLKLESYQDAVGVWTIGYGHTIDVKPGQVITMAQAVLFLQDDIKWASTAVNTYVTVDDLTQSQFDALVDFTFNLGCYSLRTSQLLMYVNKEDFKDAELEFLKWDHANGKVYQGLLLRRQAEQLMFEEK